MHREDQFIPHLCVSDGLAALEFYKSVFGAEAGEGHRRGWLNVLETLAQHLDAEPRESPPEGR